jgi:hypothetical protein
MSGGGVQVELPPRIRGLGPFWDGAPPSTDPDGLQAHTVALIEGLAEVAATSGGNLPLQGS